jgi:hypothetical protein
MERIRLHRKCWRNYGSRVELGIETTSLILVFPIVERLRYGLRSSVHSSYYLGLNPQTEELNGFNLS